MQVNQEKNMRKLYYMCTIVEGRWKFKNALYLLKIVLQIQINTLQKCSTNSEKQFNEKQDLNSPSCENPVFYLVNIIMYFIF